MEMPAAPLEERGVTTLVALPGWTKHSGCPTNVLKDLTLWSLVESSQWSAYIILFECVEMLLGSFAIGNREPGCKLPLHVALELQFALESSYHPLDPQNQSMSIRSKSLACYSFHVAAM